MNRNSIRRRAVATASAVAMTGVALGVGAWTERPPKSTASIESTASAAQTAQQQSVLAEHRSDVARAAAVQRVAAKKAAAKKAAAKKAAEAKAARERAAREKAAAERAAEEAAERAARERAEQRAAERAEDRAEQERASRGASRSGDPRAIAEAMVAEHGWGSDQFSCLDSLWQKESGWDHTAQNPSSGAYGIPQSLPGEKMASAGGDWQTNPATQIEWGLGYIAERYGSPCSAWGHSQANNWY